MTKNITTSGLTKGPDSVVDWLNDIASGRGDPGERSWSERDDIAPAAAFYAEEDVRQLAGAVWSSDEFRRKWTHYEHDMIFSSREAQVTALKDLGLTHEAISLLSEFGGGEPMTKSTVDEYSRRAREKYEKARTTADDRTLKELYG